MKYHFPLLLLSSSLRRTLSSPSQLIVTQAVRETWCNAMVALAGKGESQPKTVSDQVRSFSTSDFSVPSVVPHMTMRTMMMMKALVTSPGWGPCGN